METNVRLLKNILFMSDTLFGFACFNSRDITNVTNTF